MIIMLPLSVKQKMTLEAIEWFIHEYGYSPTFKELADLLEKNVCTVFKKVVLLEEKGYVKTDKGKSRTIQVIRSIHKF